MIQFLTDSTVQQAITDVAELLAALSIMAAVALFKRYTGIQLSAAMVDRLKSAAATEAGAIVARAEDNLRGTSVVPGDKDVVQAAANIAERNPDAVAALGVTPAVLQKFVVGEIGKLQAIATDGGSNG